MCGILAILGEQVLAEEALEKLKILIDKRGPDYSSPICDIPTGCSLDIKFKASVLHLRGRRIQYQPVTDELGNSLLFNGQVYNYSSEPLDLEVSDTTFLSNRLRDCNSELEIAETIAQIDGPFAFIYWSNAFKTLFYGRDLFGRKSLCLMKDKESQSLIISSIALNDLKSNKEHLLWEEVDCSGIHSTNFSSLKPVEVEYKWPIDDIYPKTTKCQQSQDNPSNKCIYLSTNILWPQNQDLRRWSDFSVEEHKIATLGLEEKIIQAISKRIKYNRLDCLECRINPNEKACQHSKVAVAFSGGIDSTFVALILDSLLPEKETIDLSTVAFKSDSPDRASVGSAFRELRKLRPTRNWRLIICDVTKETLQQERDETIRYLIHPCNTVIDDSLGCGCWFIGRAKGRALDSSIDDFKFNSICDSFLKYNPNTQQETPESEILHNYTSPASIFFAGMSIDEQLGGYSSHRSAYARAGIKGINDEISFQMRRLSSRNLGRDDRTFSHHGRDVKIPYLDKDLVSYINSLPVGLKMSLDDPPEVGPKKILRELACKWGLEDTCKRIKRALQFGTRIANLEDTREKGNDICVRLTSKLV